ncbi:restriction endonuclease subunit S [Acinetobacter sp. AC1-2]|uniref:restriction endonuclease subunit S n=1 Tax=Acinetobacter sp. AC1-2 TaxID=2735132 RepID=UPI0018E165A3|nr:restriction endonuclease subunit S [Acinetobacter sp. AC1-2]MBI1448677.1 restriction endonuclease subunit S [Acinetobacter sp. AC1-2]
MAKYQKYAEYKDSGVEWLGKVPEHWEVKKIKYLGSILNGYAFPSDSFTDEGIKVLKISNIQTMYLDWSDLSFVSEEQANKLVQFLVKKGDLVFALTRPIISTGIKATLMDLEEKILLNQRNAILRPNNLCVQKWLYYMILNQNFVQEFNNQIDKTGQQPNISTVSIGNLAAFVAPIEEQLKIVDFLDHETAKIDTLITKQEKLIELLKEKRQAVISQAVTKGLNPNVLMKDSGVEWLGKVPEHWDVKKIKYLGSILNGYAFSSDSFTDQGVKVLKISNIQTMYLDWSDLSFVSVEQANKLEQFLVKKGDLVFALTRPIISTGIKATLMDLEEKILLNQRNAILRPNNLCVQKWLYYMVLNQNFVQEFNNQIDKTGQQPNISTVSIGNLAVSVAPIEEQVKIVEFIAEKVERIDVLIKKAESAIQLMQERRTALISAAVTGKIDVRNWQNSNKNNNQDNMELSA